MRRSRRVPRESLDITIRLPGAKDLERGAVRKHLLQDK
jgi:hypothetical protein